MSDDRVYTTDVDFENLNTNQLHVSEDFDGEITGAVPIGELEELIEAWQTLADNPGTGDIYAGSFRKSSEELETIVEAHRDD